MIEMFRNEDVILVTFPSEEFLGVRVLSDLHDGLQKLLDEQKPSIVQFDLTNVVLITSEILGFFIALHSKSVRVVLCNPSADVREVVEITKLDQFLELVSDHPVMHTDWGGPTGHVSTDKIPVGSRADDTAICRLRAVRLDEYKLRWTKKRPDDRGLVNWTSNSRLDSLIRPQQFTFLVATSTKK